LEKWPLFMGLAVERFEEWIRHADSALAEGLESKDVILPPLGTFSSSSVIAPCRMIY
jgi:hypothetical protein